MPGLQGPDNKDSDIGDEFMICKLETRANDIEDGIAVMNRTRETIRMTIDSGSAVTIIPNTRARDYPSQVT